MQVIWHLDRNYNRSGKIKEHTTKITSTMSLTILLAFISRPFATIIDIGNKINIISEPFLSGKKIIKLAAIIKLKITSTQLLLKIFFTDNTLGVFNAITVTVQKPIKISGTRKNL